MHLMIYYYYISAKSVTKMAFFTNPLNYYSQQNFTVTYYNSLECLLLQISLLWILIYRIFQDNINWNNVINVLILYLYFIASVSTTGITILVNVNVRMPSCYIKMLKMNVTIQNVSQIKFIILLNIFAILEAKKFNLCLQWR